MSDTELEQAALRKLAQARMKLVQTEPYFSKTIYGFVPYFYEGLLKTIGAPMGVSQGLVLIIDPEFIMDISVEMLAGCLCHEVHHIVRDIDRLDHFPDRDLANRAADCAINCHLIAAGWPLPEWGCFPKNYGFEDNLTIAQYYKLLEQKKKDDPEFAKALENDKPKIAGGRCGGCAGNPLGDIEGVVDAEIGRTALDKERIKKATALDVQKHVEQHGRGHLPADYVDELDFSQEEPTIPWRQELQQIIRRATGRILSGRTDFSWKRPSRRSFLYSSMKPGMVTRQVEMAFIRDTSGSMGPAQLNAANNEIIHIFKSMGVDSAWLLDADTRVSMTRKVRVRDIPELQFHGRGGTSFIEPLEQVAKLKPRPNLVIYLTDGDGTAPADPPVGFEVIWCIVPTSWGHKPAEWGHTIVMNDEQELRDPY